MTSKICINQDGQPVTVEDLEKPAWLASAVDPSREIFIYGVTDFASARQTLAAAFPRTKATLAALSPKRQRRLVAPLHGDGAGDVIIEVTSELRGEVEELRELADKARSRMGGSVDITLRGKVDAITLYYIDVGGPHAWWDSFADRGAPAWIPEDIATAQLTELAGVVRTDCYGVQLWDSDVVSIRCICHPKHGEGRMESADLVELLYPFATREAAP